MIIGINGYIGNGKDTVGDIIRYLISTKQFNKNSVASFESCLKANSTFIYKDSGWEIKKFAGKLKQIVSILTGIPIEDLEKQEIKEKLLGEEWTRYGTADGFWYHSSNKPSMKIMHNQECSKEDYEAELRINWQTAYKQEYTPRILLQYIGTDLFRDKVLNNVWVNALFADYKAIKNQNLQPLEEAIIGESKFPNWIITDTRFPNEAQAIKDKGGIVIRINRGECTSNHPSEKSLDDYEFDYTVENNGTIKELVEKVREMLIHFKII